MRMLQNFFIKVNKKIKVEDMDNLELSSYLNCMALSDSWADRKYYLKQAVYLINRKYNGNIHISHGNKSEKDSLIFGKLLKKLQVLGRLYGN